MKTYTEQKFDFIIKQSFHNKLKPLGFKKKGNNFYLKKEHLGLIINIQKSAYYSKEKIHFTINIGVFIPEYYLTHEYHKNILPEYPLEPDCAIRSRIGQLKNQSDIWFDIDENTDPNILINEMDLNLENWILPYFKNFESKDDFIKWLDSANCHIHPLSKLIIFAEYGLYENAKDEYNKLMSEKFRNPYYKQNVIDYGLKYKLT
ncbi:DUF4304 domain-containing protein [Pedobacter terrae]|uniref:DUF4304 domain-containing protein n=1 Tax=Pedobacter terrae TaxID=405671 RepID=UPI002FF73E74